MSDASSLQPPTGYTTEQIIFEERFDGTHLDTSKWLSQLADGNGIMRNGVPAPYSGGGGYDAAYYDPAQVVVNDGLTLVAERSSAFPSYAWKSGCADTHGTFTFSGGYVQIRAKMPDSRTGMWGEIWLAEGGPNIGLASSGYTAAGISTNATIAANLENTGSSTIVFDTGVDASSDYHVYGLEYVPGATLTMYFDGEPVATTTQNVPTGSYTIVMNLAVAQNADPWHTNYGATTPSPSEMKISGVRVYEQP